jgi:hypothetical protein
MWTLITAHQVLVDILMSVPLATHGPISHFPISALPEKVNYSQVAIHSPPAGHFQHQQREIKQEKKQVWPQKCFLH